MGNSSYEGKEWTRAFIQFCGTEVNKVLDIGPGQGTYYHVLSRDLPGCKWIGVEAFGRYIQDFNLVQFYDTLYNQDIRKFTAEEDYDVVIAGDVLEHMTKEEALAVVNNLLPRCKYFIISIPIIKWPQDAVNGNPFEVHVKDDWSDKEALESFPSIYKSFAGSHIGVYVLRGGLDL